MPKPKVFISTPIHYHIEHATQECVNHLRATAHSAEIITWQLEMGDSLISRVRNRMASRFLDSTADYLLTIDSDVIFPCGGYMPKLPNLVPFNNEVWKRNSLDVLLAHQEGIVAAVYFKKMSPHSPSLRLLEDRHNISEADSQAWQYNWLNMTGLLEVRYASSGFMLIHRRVFEAVPYPWYQPYVYRGEYLSEDWAFCQRALDAGYRIYVDPSLQLGHIGSYVYTAGDFLLEKQIRSSGGVLRL